MEKKYADVIVGISHEKIDRAFQYIVPQHLQTELEIGMCVHIPFGRGNHIQEGYVIGFSEQAELPDDKLKEIRQIVPASVKATERSIQLAAWIRSYYGCTMIAALKTVLPVKQEKKAVVYREVTLAVTENEAREYLCQAQKKHQAAKVRLLEALLEGAALSYTMVTGKLAVSPQTVTSMAAQGILRVESYETYRNPVHFDELPGEKKKLTEVQQEIADDFIRSYDAGDRTPVLLHGITGSGKTEVYMEMIDAMLQRGKQCIVLIPEIALTYQTLLRFYKRFGDAVSVMHSRLSAGERYDQMKRAKRGEVQVMIGPRSALFTPFQKLGLIIIDEEHETSYKSDSMPKYHAREVAVHLAEMTDACVVMGSATPSLEANYRAQQGIYKKYVLSAAITLCLLGTIIDMTGNGRKMFDGLDKEFGYTEMAEYTKFIKETQTLVQKIQKQDKDLYRINQTYEFSKNDAMLLGYNGMTHYSSAFNVHVNKLTKTLGLAQSYFWNSGYGSTPLTDSLFGCKYVLSRRDLSAVYATIDSKDNTLNDMAASYQNNMALPFAYAVSDLRKADNIAQQSVFSNENSFVTGITGKHKNYFWNCGQNPRSGWL